MTAGAPVDPWLVQRTAAPLQAPTPLHPRPDEVDRAAADVGIRLAMWLADASAEAVLTPLGAADALEDPAPKPTPE